MGVTFRILEDYGLVYVSYGRVANVPDARTAFDTYRKDPRFQSGHKHFVDLSQVEEIDHDVPDFLKLQLSKVEGYLLDEAQTIIVYYAPHDTAFELARLCARSWEMMPSVVTMIIQDEAEALSLVGVPHHSIAMLLERAPEIG